MHSLGMHIAVPAPGPSHRSLVPQRPKRFGEPDHPVLVPPPHRDPRPRPPHRPILPTPTSPIAPPKNPRTSGPSQGDHRPPGRSAAERPACSETTSNLRIAPERAEPHPPDPIPQAAPSVIKQPLDLVSPTCRRARRGMVRDAPPRSWLAARSPQPSYPSGL